MKAEVYPGRVDMYDDLFIANTWNHARVSRLFISGLIVRCAAWVCHPVDYRTTPEYATCARLGVDMVVDILASIPYHLGWRLDQHGALQAGDLSGFDSGTDDFTSPRALGGFFVIWPLFCCSSSDYTTDAQRTWIRGRMNLIADVMGLNQAKVIAAVSSNHLTYVAGTDCSHSSKSAFHLWSSVVISWVTRHQLDNNSLNGRLSVQNLKTLHHIYPLLVPLVPPAPLPPRCPAPSWHLDLLPHLSRQPSPLTIP